MRDKQSLVELGILISNPKNNKTTRSETKGKIVFSE